MIQPLYPHNIVDHTGAVYGVRQPDNQEIVEKINEIIEVLNKLIEPKEQINEQNIADAGKNSCKESRCTTGSVWPSAE